MKSQQNILKSSFRLVEYYRRPIFRITAGLFLLALVFSLLRLVVKPTYEATAKVTMLPSKLEIGFTSGRPDFWGVSPAMVLSHTHTEFLLSRSVAEDVVRAAVDGTAARGTQATEDVGAILRKSLMRPVKGVLSRLLGVLNYGWRWDRPKPFDAAVQALRNRTKVANVPGSYILLVTVQWENPKVAALAANLITEQYVERTLKANQEAMRITRDFIDRGIRETQADLATIDEKIRQFKEDTKLYTVNQDISLRLDELSQYVQNLNRTKVELQELDTRLEALRDYETPNALVEVAAQRAGIAARQDALEGVIEEQVAKLDLFPAQEYEALELFREKTEKDKNLRALQDRLLDTKIAEAAQLSAVRIIDKAKAPVYPSKPKLLVNSLVAILVGLILSGGYVLAMESRRGHARSVEDFADFGKPMAGLLPYCPAEANGQAQGDCHAVFTHHLEHLMVRLAESARGKVILFAGLHPGEGKTFIVAGLARAAARAGRRVLLIDACVSQPHLHDVLGQPLKTGLSDVLTAPVVLPRDTAAAANGGAGGETAAPGRPANRNPSLWDTVTSVDEHIDLIGAGEANGNSAGRWNTDGVRAQLRQIAAGYDLVLMDSAPLRNDPAARRLWPLTDEMVCVFDATSCTREDLDGLSQRVEDYPHKGSFVLNKVKYRADYLFGS